MAPNNTKELIKAIQSSDEAILNRIVEKNAGISLAGTAFKGNNISAMQIHDIACPDTVWENCIFNDVEFNAIDFQHAKFTSCTFHQCKFTKAILAETAFEGCVFNHLELLDTEDAEALEINNCQFQDSTIRGLHFIDSVISSTTYTQGTLADIDGEGELKSFVLRSVTIENFATADMKLTACTASACATLPAGFKSVEGRRRRV